MFWIFLALSSVSFFSLFLCGGKLYLYLFFLSFIPILWGRFSWEFRGLTYLCLHFFPTCRVSNFTRYKDLFYLFPVAIRYLYFLMNSLHLFCELPRLDKANEQILRSLQKSINIPRSKSLKGYLSTIFWYFSEMRSPVSEILFCFCCYFFILVWIKPLFLI